MCRRGNNITALILICGAVDIIVKNDFSQTDDWQTPTVPEVTGPGGAPLTDYDLNGEEENSASNTPSAVTELPAANGSKRIHCLTVIGQIEGHYSLPQNSKATRYEQIIPLLAAIEEDPSVEGLLVLLNTVGGDVEAGLAIAELIAGMNKPVVSLVLGGGHSIGVPLAVSAKMSFIVPTATMTVHPVRMNGLFLGVPQTVDAFLRIQDRITDFVVAHSRVKRERFGEMMSKTGQLVGDVGTILTGDMAVKEGIIDRLGSLSDALAALYNMINQGEKTQ